MNRNTRSIWTRLTASFCAVLMVPSGSVLIASPPALARTSTGAAAARQTTKIPADQLDSLVAPIALYPDPLLAQMLAASTYPLEIVQLQQWLEKNPTLKDDALAAAVEKQDWDPSVQAMAGVPEAVKRLSDDIKWTTELGNAFLAQQSDVMDAVQRMRKKASDAGTLKTTPQQKVTTEVVQTEQVIVIQQANPQVIYVPAYNPVVVYGPPVYPYPPIYYPPVGYYAAGVAIGFGVGVAMGAFWGGGWGYGPRWGYGSVHINVNNRYVNHYNRYNSYNRMGGANGNWNHNPVHRGGAPYADRATANRYSGTTRGDSAANRKASAARQNQGTAARPTPSSGANRSSGRPSGGTTGATRSTGSAAASDRAANPGANRAAGSTGAADRVGNRSIPRSSPATAAGGNNAFGGASSGRSNGAAANSASQRGSSSVGASRSRSGGGGRRR